MENSIMLLLGGLIFVVISSILYMKFENKNNFRNTVISLVFSCAFIGFYVRGLFESIDGYKIILLFTFSTYTVWLILKVLKVNNLK